MKSTHPPFPKPGKGGAASSVTRHEKKWKDGPARQMAKSFYLIIKADAACLRQCNVLHHVLQLLLFFRFLLL
jgi:hypothetical protein